MSQAGKFIPVSGPGSGTVTSITFNGGLTSTPDPVTTAGTATIDQTNLTVQDGTVYWDTGTQLLHTTATGTAGQVLTSNGVGVAPTYQSVGGGTVTGLLTQDTHTVTPTAGVIQLSGSGLLNTTGTVGPNTATVNLTNGTNGQVIVGGGANAAWATLAGTQGVTYTTGANSLSIGLVNVPNSALANSSITLSNGNNITVTGSPVSLGGTASFNLTGTTIHTVQLGNAGGSLTSLANGTTGQILSAQTGADPIWASPASSSISITGDTGGALVGAAFTFTGGTTGLKFGGAGSTETLSGTLAVANGGTGATNLTGIVTANNGTGPYTASAVTQHSVLVGGASNLVSSVAVGTTGQVLTGVTGGDPTFQSPAASSISITGNSGGTLTGAAFTFTGGTTGLTFAGAGSTETLGGTLAIANGGTNATSMATTYGVVYYDGTRLVTSGVGTATQVLTSNGAGVAPTFQAAGGGGGITTINGDSGSVTGSTVTIYANSAANNCGQSVKFVNSGTVSTFYITDLTGGNYNTVVGYQAGGSIPFASVGGNCAMGDGVLAALNTSGANWNTVFGSGSLVALTAGVGNTVIGKNAGNNYTGSESSNICIGAFSGGAVSTSNQLHIGSGTGTSNGQLNAAYISGIQGITVIGTAVLVSSSDQLGISVSSRRYKENIEDLGSLSDKVFDLRPVKFNYIVGEDNSQQTGLIAEEVHEVMPSLVVYDKEGLPQTVKYHDLPVLLLNELQKALKRIEALELQLKEKQ